MISFVVNGGGGGDIGAIVPFVIIGFIILAVVIRLCAGSMDNNRIQEQIEAEGKKVRSIDWAPMGRGWAGSKNERIYEVVYEDAQGNVHRAFCKTSALAGVYWTEDKIIEPAAGSETKVNADDLAAENQRLREEVERLKNS
jgi:hypothetical protein